MADDMDEEAMEMMAEEMERNEAADMHGEPDSGAQKHQEHMGNNGHGSEMDGMPGNMRMPNNEEEEMNMENENRGMPPNNMSMGMGMQGKPGMPPHGEMGGGFPPEGMGGFPPDGMGRGGFNRFGPPGPMRGRGGFMGRGPPPRWATTQMAAAK